YEYTRVSRKATERRSGASITARAVSDRGLPGPGERADPARRSGSLEIDPQRWIAASGELDLGGVRGSAADDLAWRHPLRNQMVQARYDLARCHHRRSVPSHRHHAPERVPSGRIA